MDTGRACYCAVTGWPSVMSGTAERRCGAGRLPKRAGGKAVSEVTR